MAASPEHTFLAKCVGDTIAKVAQVPLFGIEESERRTFDYGCILQRDLSRPLVAQVLWGHYEGIEKDIRTLVHDHESKLKLYLVKDETKVRAKIEEIAQSYKSSPTTAELMRGLRLFFLPPDFDA